MAPVCPGFRRLTLASEGRELKLLFHQRNKKVVSAGAQDRPAHDHLAFSPRSISRLNGLYSVAQPSKIIERLNKMKKMIFRDQGISALIFVVDGDRPSCAHRNFPENYLTRYCRQELSLFNRREGTKRRRSKFARVALSPDGLTMGAKRTLRGHRQSDANDHGTDIRN
jgi:hypothetical protein